MANATDGLVADTTPLRTAGNRVRDLKTASARASQVAAGYLETPVLSAEQFLNQVQIEKRRADRTKSPLSLVLVRVDAERGGGFATVTELLDFVGRCKRETDIVGHVSTDRIGLLLPHTDEQGVQVFIGNLSKRAAHLPVAMASATYPDHLFDNLMSDAQDVPDTLAFLFDERTELTRAGAALKRVIDIVGSLVAIIAFSPIMLFTAIAVAVTSPGPVIFRQTRIGKGGAPFVFYKFRSMRANADDRIHREYVANLIEGNLKEVNQGDATRPVYKMTADPRVTPVGRMIRKTSVDELPQLFNVLKGDMSLVGPRPPLPYEAEKYQSWHLRRVLQIRPGITGLWQVEGRSTTSFDEMVRLDLRYIRHCSLWLDLRILLRTVMVVLRRDGAG
jgi:exopolysaccharide biosynthesis polyprenyl glycosylphosphotransferase